MSGKNEPCNHPAHSKSVDGNVSTLYPGFFSHTVGNVLSRYPVCMKLDFISDTNTFQLPLQRYESSGLSKKSDVRYNSSHYIDISI